MNGACNMLAGPRGIGQRFVVRWINLHPILSRAVQVEYGRNLKKNGLPLVFQPLWNTALVVCIGVAFHGRVWDQLCHSSYWKYTCTDTEQICYTYNALHVSTWWWLAARRQCSTPQIKSCSSIPCKQGLPWLAQSPDLNPVEWESLGCGQAKPSQAKEKLSNLNKLEKCVKRAWKVIPKHMIENLVDSTPNWIQAVIVAGGPTKY